MFSSAAVVGSTGPVTSSTTSSAVSKELLDNVEKYRDADAVIFEGIDFHGVWFFLMTKNYPALAKHFVDLRETRRSDDEIIALLKKRTGAIDCTKPEILAAVPA